MRVPSQQTHAWRAPALVGSGDGRHKRPIPPRDAEGHARGASPATAIAATTLDTRTPTHTTQALKRDPHPRAWGATGLLARHLPRPPRTTPTGAWARSISSSSTFSSVTCHRGRVPRRPPIPVFGYEEPGNRHAAPGRDPAGREEVHRDPQAAQGGGWSGLRDPQHGHPSAGARATPAGLPSRGLRPGVWHSLRAASGCGPLEDVDLVPLDAVQVIVQRQQHLRSEGSRAAVSRGGQGQPAAVPAAASTYQEGAEHGDGGEEVPDVVVVKEVEQDAVAVVLPGLGRRFLSGTGPAVTAPAGSRPAPPRRTAPPSRSPARC